MERKYLAMIVASLTSAMLAGCGDTQSTASAGSVSSLSDLSLAASADVTPPSAPSNLMWTNDGMTVTLTWGASTDDVGVVGYDLWFGNFFLGSFSDTSLSLIGFKSGTQYTFTVKARDAAGNTSVASNQTTVILGQQIDSTPPTAPSNLRSTNATSASVSLAWNASSDDTGVVIYHVYSNGLVVTNPTSTSATVTGLSPSTSYTFTVTAQDATGNVSNASSPLSVTTLQGADTTPPSVPTNLVASNVTDTSVMLSWSASTDNVGVSSYLVYTGSTLVGSSSALSLSVGGLSPGTSYCFRVLAKDFAGISSSLSDSVCVTTTGSYTLTIAAGTGGSTSPAAGTYSYTSGTTVSVTANPSSGYGFSGWSGAASGTSNPVSIVMTGNKTLTAAFAAVTPQSVSINVGGAATGSFVADEYFSGGTTYSNTNTIDTSAVGSVPVAVFQSERYGEFTYTVPNLSAGSPYIVTLYFAETYLSAAGARLFDVLLNGTTVAGGFDIYAAAGAQNKGVAQSFNATATSSGQLAIQFTKGTSGVENPKVCGIDVTAGSLATYSLSVTKSGSGSGTISGGGLSCGSTCTASVVSGSTVTLTATPDSGSSFGSWGGACSGTSTTCTVTVNAAKTVTATFTPGSTFSPCPTSGDCKILPLGDSITDGYTVLGGYRIPLFSTAHAANQHITYVGSLQNGPTTVDGVTFPRNNEGHDGWTITQIAGLVPSPALSSSPNIILLHIGTNDMYNGTSVAPGAAQRLDSLVGSLVSNAPNALIVVAKIIPNSDSSREPIVQAYNSDLAPYITARISKGQHVVLVDQHANFPTSELQDGTHPNTAGYAQMASVWYAAIKQYLH
jgi:uncharacterized repeat protein (TIGR02543 family)